MFNVIYTPYPDTSCHVSLQLPCGNRERGGRACCDGDAQMADGSSPVDQPQWSPASSCAHRSLSSHIQSEDQSTLRRHTKIPTRVLSEYMH